MTKMHFDDPTLGVRIFHETAPERMSLEDPTMVEHSLQRAIFIQRDGTLRVWEISGAQDEGDMDIAIIDLTEEMVAAIKAVP